MQALSLQVWHFCNEEADACLRKSADPDICLDACVHACMSALYKLPPGKHNSELCLALLWHCPGNIPLATRLGTQGPSCFHASPPDLRISQRFHLEACFPPRRVADSIIPVKGDLFIDLHAGPAFKLCHQGLRKHGNAQSAAP
jgi:hypothetical protein